MSHHSETILTAILNTKYLENGSKHKIIELPKTDIKKLIKDFLSVNSSKKIQSDCALINYFPNALLLDNPNKNSSVKKEQTNQVKIIEKPITNNINKPEDIWDIIDNMDKENNSESLENIQSENSENNDNFTDNNTKKSPTKSRICSGCGSKGTLLEDQSSSVLVCSECGMINDDLLDHGPEWRQYYNDDGRGEGVNRCGCPSNFFFPKSSQGTILAGTGSGRLKRKQKWNSTVYKERSLNDVFEKISTICSKSNIPRIIADTAKILYKKLSDCKHKSGNNVGKQIIIRGHNRISIIAACIYKACEMNKNPRTVKEIARFFGIDEKKVTKGNKQFEKIMKNTDDNMIILDPVNSNSTEDYIRRHCPRLKVNKDHTDIAVKISNNCCRMKLASDHNPQSIAAGAILVMVVFCELNIDKRKISRLFGISDVTIDKIYKKIAPYAPALVDDGATDHLINKLKING
ncbi:putative transcription initiation factor IIb-like protein [Acanthamoeba polyphaga mimivirus]|nr:putative transcription initiation factor IIb-like protein [Hirudovirus strain Sangsue]QTF49156.1 putative transcription initiation factor IIb-like protein [Mimivirus reunion]WMV61599.1 putative transcription initiation factor IIb-like protein [Mimivirus sp.]WMV62576.1 putative transcription initiation factor IIb-like protein [Acanthamoeba polyphaga mimivirus]WMV63553.1 putative transcription initiation factor IIb-like protein [Mimivirus sp.]